MWKGNLAICLMIQLTSVLHNFWKIVKILDVDILQDTQKCTVNCCLYLCKTMNASKSKVHDLASLFYFFFFLFSAPWHILFNSLVVVTAPFIFMLICIWDFCFKQLYNSLSRTATSGLFQSPFWCVQWTSKGQCCCSLYCTFGYF